MIRVRQIKVRIEDKDNLVYYVAKKMHINTENIVDYKIIRESIDSRDKNNIYFVYEVDVKLKDENIIKRFNNDIFKVNKEEYKFIPSGKKKIKNIVVVGAGPAGLLAAYMLASYGYKPIIIERGKKIEDRQKDVDYFFETGVLNPESNVQFGEGGAGAFSDGKLNTLVKDKNYRGKKVFEILTSCGAKEEIMYNYKPHIGTDLLQNIIINLRNKIIKMGGQFRYETTMSNIIINDGRISKIEINHNDYLDVDVLVLAIGHSARDTFYMLNNYLKMEAKAFAVGLRVMHKQKMIDESQYGKSLDILGPATYKLTHTCKNKRGVYTFCMCPGGYVINSSSSKNHLCINGMSYHKRDSEIANSAVIVTIGPKDFGNNPLDGVEYQKELEKKAFELCKGKIPIQLYKDFKENIKSETIKSIKPIIKGSYELANIKELLPNYISESIIEGMDSFNNKIKGFNHPDTILAGVESRTSSPVRIIRNEDLESVIEGIYPCGEGAGYAGGITSSAIDGIKVAEAIMKKYTI